MPDIWLGILKKIGNEMIKYIIPQILNSKTARDLKARWLKDNYTQKTRDMFKKAIDDAKASVPLSDELAVELLEDQINRTEIFSWILNETPKNINLSKLNLEPYMERYTADSDLIKPFFESIALYLDEEKIKAWDPEFLQILHGISIIDQKLDHSTSIIMEAEKANQQSHDRTQQMLQSVISPVEFDDLHRAIEEGRLNNARELAIERLNSSHIKISEILDLNIVIANTYIKEKYFKDSIKYLYKAMVLCEDDSKKKRYESLVKLFENNIEEAEKCIKQAISLSNNPNDHLDIYLSVLIVQQRYSEALSIIKDSDSQQYDYFRAQIFYYTNQTEKAIQIAEQKINHYPEELDWLLFKCEISILNAEHHYQESKIMYPYQLYLDIWPLLEQLHALIKTTENRYNSKRVLELKGSLLYRVGKFHESRSIFSQLFDQERDFNSLNFKNLILASALSDDWEKVRFLLEEKHALVGLLPKEVLSLSDCYLKLSEPSKSLDLLNSYELMKESPEYYLQYHTQFIDTLFSQLDFQELKVYLASLSSENLYLFFESYFSYKNRDWKAAAKGFEEILPELNIDDTAFVKAYLINVYQSLGTRSVNKKIIDLIPTIEYWKEQESFVNAYVRSLYRLKKHKSIVILYNELLSPSIYVQEVIANIYISNKNYDLAKKQFLSLYQKTRHFDYQLQYAKCLFLMGNIKESHEVLDSAEAFVKQNPRMEDYQLLSIIHKEMKNYLISLEFAYKAFKLGENAPHIWEFYFAHFSTLSNQVKNPKKKWIIEYQKVMNNYKIRFPYKEPLFKEVTFLNKDLTDTDKLIYDKDVISILKAQQDAINEVDSLFNSYSLPVRCYTEMLNRSPFYTWTYVLNNPKLIIKINYPSKSNHYSGFEMKSYPQKLLCDFSTLLTLNHLEILDELSEQFDLYIEQNEFDSALKHFYDIKLSESTGSKSLFLVDGNIHGIEYTAANIKTEIERQYKFLEWIKENCTLVGNVISDSQIENDSFLNHTLEICKENNYLLLIDSYATYLLAQEDNNIVKVLSSFDLLLQLEFKGKITNTTYERAVTKLLITKHAYLPFSVNGFSNLLIEKNFVFDNEINSLIEYFQSPDLTSSYLLNLVSRILFWLWTEESANEIRNTLTNSLCEALEENINPRKISDTIILNIDRVTSKKPEMNQQLLILKNFMELWLKTKE